MFVNMNFVLFLFTVTVSALRPSSSLKMRKSTKFFKQYHYSSIRPLKPGSDVTRLFQYYGDDNEKRLTPKSILTLAVLTVGVYGVGFISPLKTIVKELAGGEQQMVGKAELKKSNIESNRGALTRLTRREINEKLSKVPVFFATKGDDILFVSNGVGYLFAEKNDADSYAKANNLQVSVTTMDDIFYTLIEKKTKLGAFVTGVAGKADPLATYKFVPSPEQIANTPKEWLEVHGSDDIPLFRVPGLAFSKSEGIEVPLFTRKEDAITSFNRLQEAKKTLNPTANTIDANTIDESSIEFQIISVKDLIARFSTGGFEARALEIYPSMDAINAASSMLAISP